MAVYNYQPQGVCSRNIEIELDGKTIKRVAFQGGCPGNLNAISRIVEGMDAEHVIKTFAGNPCGNRGTSCADQLSIALREAVEQEQKAV